MSLLARAHSGEQNCGTVAGGNPSILTSVWTKRDSQTGHCNSLRVCSIPQVYRANPDFSRGQSA